MSLLKAARTTRNYFDITYLLEVQTNKFCEKVITFKSSNGKVWNISLTVSQALHLELNFMLDLIYLIS